MIQSGKTEAVRFLWTERMQLHDLEKSLFLQICKNAIDFLTAHQRDCSKILWPLQVLTVLKKASYYCELGEILALVFAPMFVWPLDTTEVSVPLCTQSAFWLHLDFLSHLAVVGVKPQIKLSLTPGEKGSDFHLTSPNWKHQSCSPSINHHSWDQPGPLSHFSPGVPAPLNSANLPHSLVSCFN